jgi:heme oxygenase
MSFRLLVTLSLGLVGMVTLVRATEQQVPTQQTGPESVAQLRDDLILKQQQLASQFEEFQTNILKLKQRYERGTDEEKKNAQRLGKIIEKIQEMNLRTELDQLAEDLRKSKLTNVTEVKELKERSVRLTQKLQDLIAMFTEDPRLRELNEQTKALKDFLKTVDRLLQKQKLNQGLTEAGKTDKGEVKQNQGQITKGINDLNKAIDKFLGKGGDPTAQDAAKLKGTDKPGGEGKTAKATPKDDGDQGQQTAQGQSKDNAGDPKAGDSTAKAGDPKEGGDPKSGDAQAKDKGGDPKSGDGQSTAKAGDPKDGQSGTKSGDPKSGDSSAKAGDPKSSDSKGGQASAKTGEKGGQGGSKGSPSQSKPGDPKSGAQASAKESKGGEGSSQAKAGGQPSQSSKGGQGQAKAGEGKGSSSAKSDGQKQQGPQSDPPLPNSKTAGQGDPKEGNPGGNPPPGDNKTKDQLAQNVKKVLEAGYDSFKAEQAIPKDKKQAIKNQDDVIDNLDAFKKKLEDLLRQTREEELEKLLAHLEARCKKMLEMQIQVLAGTEQTHKAVVSRVDKKASREDQAASLKLSDQEKDIISEANKAIQLIEEEGTAVAFPEVFQQVREDMKHAQRRLEVADVGEVTQAVEKDIIETLKEMIEALKKAQKDLDDQKKGKPGQPGPPPDQKLLDKIAELKMIRSLQKRVNDRTQFYGRLFPNEQALDPEIRKHLSDLAGRQERIFEIMDRFVKGDGK